MKSHRRYDKRCCSSYWFSRQNAKLEGFYFYSITRVTASSRIKYTVSDAIPLGFFFCRDFCPVQTVVGPTLHLTYFHRHQNTHRSWLPLLLAVRENAHVSVNTITLLIMQPSLFFTQHKLICKRVRGLIFLFFLSLSIDRVDTDLFIILLKGGQILTSLRELALLHAFANVPMDEGSLGVHQVELMIKTSPGFGNRRRITQHTDGSLDLSQVAARDNSWRLVVDADLKEETSEKSCSKRQMRNDLAIYMHLGGCAPLRKKGLLSASESADCVGTFAPKHANSVPSSHIASQNTLSRAKVKIITYGGGTT